MTRPALCVAVLLFGLVLTTAVSGSDTEANTVSGGDTEAKTQNDGEDDRPLGIYERMGDPTLEPMTIGDNDFSALALYEGTSPNLCVGIRILNAIADHFRLDRSYRLLGKGGQGCVLLMTSKEDKKEYAVKIMETSINTWRQYEWSEFEVPRALGKSLKPTGHDHLVLGYYQKHYFENEEGGVGVILMDPARGELLSDFFFRKALTRHIVNVDEVYRDMMKQLVLFVEHMGEVGISVSKQPVKDDEPPSSALKETSCTAELSKSIGKSSLEESSLGDSSSETAIRKLSYHDLKPENIMIRLETEFYENGFKNEDDDKVVPLRYVPGSCKLTVFDFGGVRDCSAQTLARGGFNPATPLYSDPAVSLTCLARERRADVDNMESEVAILGPPSWVGDVSQCWTYDLWSVAAIMKLVIGGEGPNERYDVWRNLIPESSPLRANGILSLHYGFFYAESFDEAEYERTVDVVPRIGCGYIARSAPVAACTAAMKAMVPLDVNSRLPPSEVLKILKPVAVGGHLLRGKSPVFDLQRQCKDSNAVPAGATGDVEPPVETDPEVES